MIAQTHIHNNTSTHTKRKEDTWTRISLMIIVYNTINLHDHHQYRRGGHYHVHNIIIEDIRRLDSVQRLTIASEIWGQDFSEVTS